MDHEYYMSSMDTAMKIITDLKRNVDWRQEGAVYGKNQLDCGGCWIITAGAAEGEYFIKCTLYNFPEQN